MRRPVTTLALAGSVIIALVATLTSSISAAQSWPTAPIPPIDNSDSLGPVIAIPPDNGTHWIPGFGADNNLLDMVDFEVTPGQREAAMAAEILTALNAERSARGLRPLAFSQEGTDYAMALTHRNAAMDMVAHSDEVGSEGTIFFFPDAGYGTGTRGYPRKAGENVGGGDAVAQSSGDALRSYMNSAPHRTSLLGGNYDAVGIGVACVVYYDPQFDAMIGNVFTAIVPVKTQDLPPSYEDPSYGPYPQGNPPPAGTVTPANSGTACYDDMDQNNGGVQLGPVGTTTPPPTPTTTTQAPTTSTTWAPHGAVTNPDANYVDAVYELFLKRSPSQSEKTTAVALVESLGRTALTGSLSTSTEWAGVVVDGIYRNALGRNPDPGGRAHWVARLDAGDSTRSVAVSIYGSNEAWDKAGGTAEGYARYLYAAILGRQPDAGGLAHWTYQLEHGLAPWQAVAGFWDSIEFRRLRVKQVYADVLGRAPDAGGWAYWADRLLGMDEVRLAAMHAASDEFYNAAQP